MTNTLVLYYSATGTTRNMAHQLASQLNADIAEVHAAKPYTTADLNWHDPQSRTSIEQHQHDSRSAIVDDLPNLDSYDNIIIASPIWWGIPPRLIADLIDKLPLDNKTVAACATSGGSTFTRCQSFIERTIKENNYQNVTVKQGTVLSSANSINNWANSLNLQ